MKFSASLLLLASSALATRVQRRGDDYDEGDYGSGNETTTLTTYTTVTTCPVTSTYTEKGTTYCVTALTTSTIVVTDCKGCGVTTVQGQDATQTAYETDYTTRTTVCPVTETKTVGGEVITKVYTTTSEIVEAVQTTLYDEVKGPDTTEVAYETDYTTRTTVCPVTETKTVGGEVITKIYTTTSEIVEAVQSTVYDHVKGPDTTEVGYETQYTTRTTVCPVTETETEGGEIITKIYTTTSEIVEAIQSTVYDHVKGPDTTEVGYETQYTTRTTVCPVTETKVVEGETITKIYTTTSEIVEAIQSTVYDHAQKPDVTESGVETAYTTRTTVCPVTETKVVEGETITKIYTTTSEIVEAVQSTVYDQVQKPDVTESGVETAYFTRTTVCPVTETKVVEGETITKVYTTTSEIIEAIKTTIYDEVKQPDVTKTEVDVAYITSVSLCPVTETKTINGEVITKVYTSTQYLVSQVKTTINEYQTIYQTATEVKVQTQYSKILVTVGGGTVVETLVPESTVEVPQTEVVTKPVVTVTSQSPTTPTSAPAELPTGAAVAKQPAFALMAGVLGALALL